MCSRKKETDNNGNEYYSLYIFKEITYSIENENCVKVIEHKQGMSGIFNILCMHARLENNRSRTIWSFNHILVSHARLSLSRFR